MPTYEDKNGKSLIDAHNNGLDMNGNAPKAPATAAKVDDKSANPTTPVTTPAKTDEAKDGKKTVVADVKAPAADAKAPAADTKAPAATTPAAIAPAALV